MNEVNELIGKLGQNLQELMRRLRGVLKKGNPSVGEKVRWGFPNFVLNGKDFVALIFSKDRANLAPSQGAGIEYKLPGATKGIEIKDIGFGNQGTNHKDFESTSLLQSPKAVKIPEEIKGTEFDKLRKEIAKLF